MDIWSRPTYFDLWITWYWHHLHYFAFIWHHVYYFVFVIATVYIISWSWQTLYSLPVTDSLGTDS